MDRQEDGGTANALGDHPTQARELAASSDGRRDHPQTLRDPKKEKTETSLPFQGKTVYVATVMDLFTRKIVGMSVYTTHAVQLPLSAFMNALLSNSRPAIFHSDNGSEYNADMFVEALETVGVMIFRSALGCPWENGYQESFYSQFKVDLGDPSRFNNIGDLVYEIYRMIWRYNNTRIHCVLKMSPVQFAKKVRLEYN